MTGYLCSCRTIVLQSMSYTHTMRKLSFWAPVVLYWYNFEENSFVHKCKELERTQSKGKTPDNTFMETVGINR